MRIAVPRPTVLAGAVAVLIAAAAGFGWLRDSSLFEVREVSISGPSSPDAKRIRALLQAAALEQTTLHVDGEELLAAVARHRVVAGLRTDADFPHRLDIEVIERDPVAALRHGDRRVPVTGDGTVLHGTPPERGLPTIDVSVLPAVDVVREPGTRRALQLVAAAPEPLRQRSERVTRQEGGYVVVLRAGPKILFGPIADLGAKWLAAARVLADEKAAGATYVDVRIPARPAAGGFPQVLEPEASTAALETANPQLPVETLPPATSVAPVP